MQRERLEVDVLIVGAGPAGLTAAHVLKTRLGGETAAGLPRVLVLEKGAELGGQVLSGAVVDVSRFPAAWGDEAAWGDLLRPVIRESVWLLTSRSAYRLPWIPKALRNRECRLTSLGRLTAWMGERCEEVGVDIATGFSGAELLWDGDRVVGVRVGDFGVARDGRPRDDFQPGPEIRAAVTLLAEGVRGTLAQQAIERCGLMTGKSYGTYGAGLKELWRPGIPVEPGEVIHTLGYPFSASAFGGAFYYTLAPDLVSLGVVVEIDSRRPVLDVHALLQRWKEHPFVRRRLTGGTLLKYGARALPESGWKASPRPWGEGFLILGDSAAFLDASRLKGIHLAVESGRLGAEVILDAWRAGDLSEERLQSYEDRLNQSPLFQPLRGVEALKGRWMRGLVRCILPDSTAGRASARREKDERSAASGGEGMAEAACGLTQDRTTSVGFAGIVYREDQPSHISISDPDVCRRRCRVEFGNPCRWFCPGGVFHVAVRSEGSVQVELEPGNCLHCKICEVTDPYGVVRWRPPEGGSGPRWLSM